MSIRVLICDDHSMLRDGLRTWLDAEPNLQVVGEASDAAEAVRLAEVLRPDVALMDLNMPGAGGGIAATREVRERVPGVRILILTVQEEEAMLREAMRAGASGYIVKRAVRTELIDAIRSVAAGNMYVHPVMTQALLKDMSPSEDANSSEAESLTPRELEVVRLIVRGYTSREVAEKLSLSVRTVEFHRANLMAKLGLRSRVELIRYVEEHGLLAGTKPPRELS